MIRAGPEFSEDKAWSWQREEEAKLFIRLDDDFNNPIKLFLSVLHGKPLPCGCASRNQMGAPRQF